MSYIYCIFIFEERKMQKLSYLFFIFLVACSGYKQEKEMEIMIRDPHSFANPMNAVITHLDWKGEIDFEQKKIYGEASLSIRKTVDADEIILDTKGLIIEQVLINDEKETEFHLGASDIILGSPLSIPVDKDTRSIRIKYTTGRNAEALQWLDPIQTSGESYPFLFTQSEAILARSWIPLQDSPGIRFTYTAEVKAPKELLVVMSAGNPQKKNPDGLYRFTMDQPIPAYLLALAVGDLQFKEVGPRTGVYAEPSIIRSAAYEFAEMEDMLKAAEKLYGPYQWGRYDLLVLPPSFPFGGMENPRLTFATPTILAGDRSLTSLVAHELAHSWSGNLVTNGTWNDFWLNEGFTVYFENRIMEALNGKSYSDMLASLSYQDLLDEVENLISEGKGPDTRLALQLDGRNPDDGVSSVAYDKGFFFLKFLESKVGREKFDLFLKKYFADHQFESMTTDKFIIYLDQNLMKNNPGKLNEADIAAWIFDEGIPPMLVEPVSDRFAAVDEVLIKWKNGTPITTLISREDLITKTWSTHEWLHFLRNLPDQIADRQMHELDDYMDFTHSGNAEILAAWFEPVIRNEYKPGYANLENFLLSVGRRKFLIPLYKEMLKSESGKKMASEIYTKARNNYHYVSTNTLDQLLGWRKKSL